MPSAPDPVATAMTHEGVRHGKTVFSEPGVSASAVSSPTSAEGRGYRDTGIQLAAAAPPDVPGALINLRSVMLQLTVNLQQSLTCLLFDGVQRCFMPAACLQ